MATRLPKITPRAASKPKSRTESKQRAQNPAESKSKSPPGSTATKAHTTARLVQLFRTAHNMPDRDAALARAKATLTTAKTTSPPAAETEKEAVKPISKQQPQRTPEAQAALNCALVDAVCEEKLDRVVRLLKEGAIIDGETRQARYYHSAARLNKYSLLALAIYQENVEIVRALLEAGADPHGKCKKNGEIDGFFTQPTALDYAGHHAKPKFLELLLEHKADPNIELRCNLPKEFEGRTGRSTRALLHPAIAQGSVEKVRALLAARADPNAIYREKQYSGRGFDKTTSLTPLGIALIRQKDNACGCRFALDFDQQLSSNRSQIVWLLLQHKADPNLVSTHTIHKGVEAGDKKFAYTEEGLAFHTHATPLHFAIIRKEAEIVYSLLLHGADTSIDHTTTVDRPRQDSTTLSTQQLLDMVIAGQPLRTAKVRDAIERTPLQQADYLRALVWSPPRFSDISALLQDLRFSTPLVNIVTQYLHLF